MAYAKIELTYTVAKEVELEVENEGNFDQQIEGAVRDFLDNLKNLDETDVNLYVLHEPCYSED